LRKIQLIFLTLCGLSIPLSAQADVRVCEKERSLLNDQEYLDASVGVMKQPACLKLWEPKRTKFNLTRNLRGAPWVAYTTHKKVKFYRDKRSLSSKRKGRSPKGECAYPPYVVKASYSRNNKVALYLAKAERTTKHTQTDAKNCGWVNIDDLIVDSIPIRNGYDIDHKAVIIFDWKTVEKKDLKALKDHSLLYSRADRRSSEIGKLPSEDIAYIYKDLKVGKERWYYIITDSSIDGDRLGRATSGWIPATSVQRWDTSEAVYPSPKRRKNNAVVYRDESAAQKESSSEIVAPDQGNKVARPVDERPYLMLPIRESRHRSRRRSRGCRDCKMVAYIGAAYYGDTMTTNNDENFHEERKKEAVSSDAILEASETANFVFVIDATASFDNFLNATKKTIKSLKTEVGKLKRDGVKLNFRAVIYRDEYAGRKKIETIVAKNLRDMNRKLQRIKVSRNDSSSGDKDREEAVDCALESMVSVLEEGGANSSEFKNYFNFIIAFGDNGNSSKESCGGVESVIQSIKRRYRSMPSLAVRVFGMSHSRGKPQSFGNIMENFQSTLGSPQLFAYSEHTKDSASEIRNALEDWITPIIDQISCVRNKSKRMAQGMGVEDDKCKTSNSNRERRRSRRKGTSKTVDFDLEAMHKAITIERISKESDISQAKAEEIWERMKMSRASIPLEGYVRADKRFNNLILFSKFDLSDYISTIAEIAEYGDKVSIIKALKKTCQQLSRSSNVTSSSCNNMRDAINNTGDYDLWKYPAEDILKKLKNKRFLNPILDKSQTTLKKLKSLNRNQRAWFKIGDQEYVWVKQTEML
jgi:hypothetical protein